MFTLAQVDPGCNFARWPATLAPDYAERCYYDARAASRAWVDGLATRSGVPRWHRIARCGDPVAVCRVGDGALSWQHRWCRDRACYACARSRSRRLATSLRSSVERRADAVLFFVTLTIPKQPQTRDAWGRQVGATRAWDTWQRTWERLRHLPEYTRAVAGGVRAQETTWSRGHQQAARRFEGWHHHGHLLVEVNDDGERMPCPSCGGSGKSKGNRSGNRCGTCTSATHKGDGTLPAVLAALLVAWARLCDGSTRAQCAVPLDRTNVGQLAKYMTKLWELPAERAREVFDAAEGRRIVEGFGTWRGWQRWGAVEKTPSGWFPSGLSLRLIEAMAPDELVPFVAGVPAVLEPADAKHEKRAPKAARPFDDDANDGDGAFVTDKATLRALAMRPGRRRLTRPARRGPSFRPVVEVAAVPASRVLAALRADARPVWERVEATTAEAARRAELVALQVMDAARLHRGHTLDPPAPSRTWEF